MFAPSSRPQFSRLAGVSSHYGNRRHTVTRALDCTRSHREPVRTEDDPAVELLLCASDLARRGVDFALTAAVEALGLAFTDAALDAALAAREVGALYGESMSADAYLEAAYRLMEG